MQGAGDGALIREAVVLLGVADAPDHVPGAGGVVHLGLGGDLAHDVDGSRLGGDLTGAAAHGVLGQQLVQDAVGDLVADLVRMALRDGFGGKKC